MRAGKLRHKLRVQEQVRTRTTDGGFSESWEDVYTVWGSINPLRGPEALTAEQLKSEITCRINVRYHSGITNANRMVLEASSSQIFDIKSVINPEYRNIYLTLMCKEEGL